MTADARERVPPGSRLPLGGTWSGGVETIAAGGSLALDVGTPGGLTSERQAQAGDTAGGAVPAILEGD